MAPVGITHILACKPGTEFMVRIAVEAPRLCRDDLTMIPGGIQINGPATANYDTDLGHVLLGDWTHVTADAKFAVAQYQGSRINSDNGLINGKNVYNSNGQTVGSRFEMSVQKGKTYRIRLVNTAIDTHYAFSIDGHNLTVIANDLVPIKPYTTNTVNIAIGKQWSL